MHQTWTQLPAAVRTVLAKAHDEMCRAIDEEMAAEGKLPVTLPAGERVGDSVGAMRNTYRFAIGTPRDLVTGDAITCRFPSSGAPGITFAYSGTVAATSSRQLVITFRDDLGPHILAGGVYVPRESICLVDVQDQLRRIVAGVAPFNAGVALQLLGGQALLDALPTAHPARVEMPRVTVPVDGLRFEQAQAVEDFCSRQLAVLWGPPGTGKTHVVSHGVAGRARHGHTSSPPASPEDASVRPRILVVASSNLAVDELMSRVASHLADVRSVRAGRVIRYGRQVTPALIESHGDQIVFDRVVERIRRQRMQRAVLIAARLESRLDELQEVSDLLLNLPLQFDDERERLARRRRRLTWYVARFDAVMRDHVIRFTQAFRSVNTMGREVLERCQVLGTTVHQALLSRRIRDARWDCVVLEEGSQISAALGYILAIRARDTAWLAGDFRQLEPVTAANTPLTRRWMGRDLFSTSRSYSEGPDGAVLTQPFVSRLEIQQRMHPEICAAVNGAYGGGLRTDSATERDRLRSTLHLPFSQCAGPAQRGIYLVDTTELNPSTHAAPGGSRENPVHVAVVRALLEVFDGHGLLPAIGSAPGRIAVISPFHAQARWHASVVEQRFPGRGIRCDTVHSFQGQGVDLLIVDLTESKGVALTEWMHAREWSESGGRLLTVALSRCKERCLVIADCGSLYAQLQSLAPRPLVYRLLRYLEQWGGSVDVRRDIITPVQALREARRLAAGAELQHSGTRSS